MNKLSRVANIVDDFIYQRIPITQARSAYDKIIKPAYEQLSYRPSEFNFYNGKQLRGYITPGGEVGFVRKYPELNLESYSSPEELLNSPRAALLNDEQKVMIANSPQPTRELIKLGKSFQDYSNTPDGSRLYYNTPISDHREKAYKKWGFDSIYDYENQVNVQYFDKRPYADNDLINKVYGIGDTFKGGNELAQLTLSQRAANDKINGSRIANLNNTLGDIDDYTFNASSVPSFRREEYINPYLPQQQVDSSRFAAMRQASIDNNPQSIIRRYIAPEHSGQVQIFDPLDGTYDLYYGDVYRSLNQHQFAELHRALRNDGTYQYEFNPF